MNQAMKERFLISPFLVFFLINSTQVGIGMLSFQRLVMKEAGHDAWIAVILTGIIVHLLIWIMYQLFAHSPDAEDIVSIHQRYFGKWIGFVFNFALLVYFFLLAFTVLQTYIEIIKIWMFPLMGAWQLSLIFLALAYYTVLGGFRVVTWPTLTLAKIPAVPFIERMEYIIISIYVLVVFPIICIAVWSASRVAKKLFSIKQRRFVPVILLFLFIGTLWFEEKEQIERLNKWTSTIGLYFVIFYIPALYIYVKAANKIKKIMQSKS